MKTENDDLDKINLAMSEDSGDIAENSFFNEQRDKKRIIEYSLSEEYRLTSNLPGLPPMTFCIGSHIRVKYLGDEIPPFCATIVSEDIIPFFEWQDDYSQRYKEYTEQWESKRLLNTELGELVGTPICVHSNLVKAVYGKISGVYRVVVEDIIYRVEVMAL